MWTGMPSSFVRVSGCNLRCSWCDTPYASWKPEGPMLQTDEIVRAIEPHALRHVVLTGGEPMLFEPIASLAESLRSIGKVITIETAGTVDRDLACDLMSISPKLASSAPSGSWRERHERTRLDREPLQRLIDKYEYQLKFVVTESMDEDLGEIDELLSGLSGIEPNRVFLMPEGRDSETLRRRAAMLVEPCLTRNWRLTMRMQIDLFGDTRGT